MRPNERILLIEDDRHIREFIISALESEGFEVAAAGTAARGIELAVDQKPQLVLLDLGLPDKDGIDLIRDFRGWSKVPIIVISARTQEQQIVTALDAGADDYLTKPFGVAELVARARAQLRRSPVGNATDTGVITFGNYSVDCFAHTVHRDGQEVRLTQIEYRLLVALASSPGQVMTHRQLLVRVWGGQASENYEYLRVYVGHLRQKIEENPTRPRHIVTEIGVGYRFQP